ncbi:hypothetical protein KKH3_17260 [Pectobacterium actinidiae]|nr:hypothetical protein KKH3_17260 [Pectobacterium actinidiae]
MHASSLSFKFHVCQHDALHWLHIENDDSEYLKQHETYLKCIESQDKT